MVSVKLTMPEKWAKFVDEYLKDFSPTAAYMRSFGGSRINAQKQGKALILRNGWVRAQIQKRSEGRITLADITPERITLELARLAMLDPRKVMRTNVVEDEDGNTSIVEVAIPLPMLDEDTARAVKKISVDARGNRVVETHDKIAALTALSRFIGMNPDPDHGPLGQRAGAITDHDAIGEDEIALMLEEIEAEESPDEIGDEIEGEYADDDET